MKLLHWIRQTLYRNGVLILAALTLFFLVHEIFGERGFLALRRQRRELETLHEQIRQLQLENQKLEAEIEALKSDPRAIEKLAREQMRMARPGELIYTLPEKPSSSGTPPAANPPHK